MSKNHFKIGSTFPPTAQGTGIMIIGIGIIILYYGFSNTSIGFDLGLLYGFIPIYIGSWIIFSKSKLYSDQISEGILKVRFGFFPFIFSRKIILTNYDAAIIKVTRQKYRVSQGIGAGMSLMDPEFNDSFIGLHFKKKGSFEEELILKGKGDDVMEFLKENIVGTHLRIFVGVVKKGYELKFDDIE